MVVGSVPSRFLFMHNSLSRARCFPRAFPLPGSLLFAAFASRAAAAVVTGNLYVGNENAYVYPAVDYPGPRTAGIATPTDVTGAVFVSHYEYPSLLPAELTITSQLTSAVGNIGYGYTGAGIATVRGAGASWTTSQQLYVGHSGSGTLLIEQGGQVASHGAAVGLTFYSSGRAVIADVGSRWTNTGDLRVGAVAYYKGKAEVLVGRGAELDTDSLTIAGKGYVEVGGGGRLSADTVEVGANGRLGLRGETLGDGSRLDAEFFGTVALAGGVLEANGFQGEIGALDLRAASTLAFAGGVSELAFADSSDFDWSGNSLSVAGYALEGTTLRFGVDASGLTPEQLGLFDFGIYGQGAQIDSNGYVTPELFVIAPVPEPASFSVLAGFGALAMAAARRRR